MFIYLFYDALSNIDITYVELFSDSMLEEKRVFMASYKLLKARGDYKYIRPCVISRTSEFCHTMY